MCWERKKVPHFWKTARVAAIYKKKDPALPENYRPISLLAVGYKIYAAALLARLKAAGAEERVWPTQFGFRSKHGPADALFVARRILDQVSAQRDGAVTFLALDWSKAFDRVAPHSMAYALRRFGVPEPFVDMVSAIYADRAFVVRDGGHTSNEHVQAFGIAQGCPLSPFLFIILMTVLLTDAKAQLLEQGYELDMGLQVHELLYADDTLLLGIDSNCLAAYMLSIHNIGKCYGLELNWDKLESISVGGATPISMPGGGVVKRKDNMIYLGSMLDGAATMTSELSRRVGMARADFNSLKRVWKHANISKCSKLKIFEVCVLSKLLYGMQVGWLTAAGRRRLDGLQARCIRNIMGVLPSHLSRVSNASVLELARARKLSTILLERQLLYLGRTARLPAHSPIRKAIFVGNTLELRSSPGKRRVGRPRQTWADEVFKRAVQIAGTRGALDTLLLDEAAWRTTVREGLHRT
jgi:hypothetical protein